MRNGCGHRYVTSNVFDYKHALHVSYQLRFEAARLHKTNVGLQLGVGFYQVIGQLDQSPGSATTLRYRFQVV